LQVIDPVIQNNAYNAHPENLLLSMTMDECKHIRELALQRILKARSLQNLKEKVVVQNFVKPKLNFKATYYTDMIDWNTERLFSPLILRNVPDEHVLSLIQTELLPDWDFQNFPAHTQAVERCIKKVTAAAQTVVGFQNRDEFVRTTFKSRNIMAKFDSKTHFKFET